MFLLISPSIVIESYIWNKGIPCQQLPVQIEQIVWDLLKVNNQDTKVIFWYLYCEIWTNNRPHLSNCIVDFEQVIAFYAVFAVNMCKLRIWAPLKNWPFNTFCWAMLHKCKKLKNREKTIKYENFDIFTLYLFHETAKFRNWNFQDTIS